MKEKEIKNDPQMTGKFMRESLTDDREDMRRKFRERTLNVGMTSDVGINYPAEMSSRQLDM